MTSQCNITQPNITQPPSNSKSTYCQGHFVMLCVNAAGHHCPSLSSSPAYSLFLSLGFDSLGYCLLQQKTCHHVITNNSSFSILIARFFIKRLTKHALFSVNKTCFAPCVPCSECSCATFTNRYEQRRCEKKRRTQVSIRAVTGRPKCSENPAIIYCQAAEHHSYIMALV